MIKLRQGSHSVVIMS